MSRRFDFQADARQGSVGFGVPAGQFWSGEGEWEGEGIGDLLLGGPLMVPLAAAEERRRQQYRYALRNAIPNDPDYRKHIPLEYRLDAKAIVGYLAQDLSKGQSAHVWVELADLGIAAAEIFELAGSLALFSPLLGFVGIFLVLAAPYQEAAQKIAADWSATGFSRGVVMGADKRRARQLTEYFGNDGDSYLGFEHGRTVSMANNRAGLVAGYIQGRMLSRNQRVIFWRDLGRRMGDQSYRGPRERWGSRDWRDWYIDVAAVFRRDHLMQSK